MGMKEIDYFDSTGPYSKESRVRGECSNRRRDKRKGPQNLLLTQFRSQW